MKIKLPDGLVLTVRENSGNLFIGVATKFGFILHNPYGPAERARKRGKTVGEMIEELRECVTSGTRTEDWQGKDALFGVYAQSNKVVPTEELLTAVVSCLDEASLDSSGVLKNAWKMRGLMGESFRKLCIELKEEIP